MGPSSVHQHNNSVRLFFAHKSYYTLSLGRTTMRWFDGFDWWNIVLNMGALALVPLLFSLYGGKLAAEGFKNRDRQKQIKRNFWALFIVGMLVTAAQQFKAARDSIPPDVKLTFFTPKNPATLASLVKSSVAKTVDVDPILWDLDALNDGQGLPTRKATYDYIKESQPGGPMQMLLQDVIGNPVKPGHRIFGFVSVSCTDCSAFHAYWVYFTFGEQNGWYAEIPQGRAPQTKLVADAMPEIRDHTEAVLAQVVPLSERKPIPEP